MRGTLRQFFLVAATLFAAACSENEALDSTGVPENSKLVVVLSVDTDSIPESSTTQLSARVTDRTGFLQMIPVSWTSTNPSIAAVSDGLITGVAPGSATIIASAGGGVDSALIVVTPMLQVLDIQPSAAEVAEGDTVQFVATVRSLNGDVVSVTQLSWNSSDTTAATFVNGGSLVAKAEGELLVEAVSYSQRGTGSVRVFRLPVYSVTISPSTANVYKGNTLQLNVTLRDLFGRHLDGPVTFGSSNNTRATVNSSGVVTGISAGSVVITATSGTRTGSATVNVLGTPAGQVILTLPSDTVPVGVEMQATATALDDSGAPLTGRTAAFQSSNPSVATVHTNTGMVKGIATGYTNLSAIIDGKVATKRLNVGGRRASSMSISPNAPSVRAGQQSQLAARVMDQMGSEMSGQSVSWSSNNQSVATVSSNGLVSASAAGSTTVTALSGGLTASTIVSVVNAPVASVSITPGTVSLLVGGAATLIASALDAGNALLPGRVATWSSQNPTVASVSSSGLLSAVGTGSTTITATIEGKSSTVSVSVGSAPVAPVTSVTVSLDKTTLSVGEQTQATAVLKDAQGNTLNRPIAWSSLDEAVAKVSASGVVTAFGGGTIAILGTSEGVTGSASLTVSQPTAAPVADVILSIPTRNLTVGQTVQAVVTLKDAQGNTLTGRTITYTSGNSSVITVSATGLVRAVGPGATAMIANSGGVLEDADFTVTGAAPTVASISVTPTTATLAIGATSQETAVAKDAQGNTIGGTSFTWTTSNAAFATVSSTGRVSGVGAGTATIRAAASGVTGSMTATVTSAPAVVASVSVTLASSSITTGATTQASAVAKDASGNVLTGKSFTWTSATTSIATVSSSGLVTGAAAGTAQIRATSDGIVGSAGVSVSAPAPPPPPPPSGSAAATIVSLIGSTRTVSETAPMGSAFAEYDRLFDQYFGIINVRETSDRLNNYYDRAKAYYARYVRTGDSKFLNLAQEVVLDYRNNYLQPNTYGVQPHNAQLRGLEIHYRLTGDTLSRRAVAGVYAHGLASYAMRIWGPLADIENPASDYMDNRIQARVLQGALASYRMNASYTRPDGLAFPASEWPTRLRDILNKILSVQKADGSYGWVQICGGQLNYMVGMLNDVLIEYYKDFEADPRIPAAVEKANEFLWSTQWIQGEQAFKYASVMCAPNSFGTNVGGPDAAGDLNGLFIASFGWLYNRTGDPKWKTRGDAVMSGIVLQKWAGSYSSSKQFNQAFAESYRYLGWR